MAQSIDTNVHITTRSAWRAAQTEGRYQTDSLESEGFIHCSHPEQVIGVANAFYQQAPELVLLWIDPRRVIPDIRWEAADGDEFPHIYGPLNLDAVTDVRDFSPDSDGVYRNLPK